ncbi:MAG: Ppx/GppA family phosphatase [Gammaproteobacteria bacterium]|nr:MAG: Ppx/GppA family phosphatase [Gammaproteobacteria bacterium]
MIVARVAHGEIRPVERFGERVQLAAGMKSNRLSQDAIDRGLSCLARFRQVLDKLQPAAVRVVGTNALRAAKNAALFIRPAEALIGQPVEVVSGREEARLVYLGVAHTLADDDNARLVVDIGGGSTEFVIGQRFESKLRESLHMGCVTYRDRFFPEGKVSAKRFAKAYQAAYQEVLSIRKHYKNHGWDNAVGSSGTMRSVELIITQQGWAGEGIDTDSLAKLRKLLLSQRHIDALNLPGLSERRRGVIVPGVAIISGVFDALGIEHMHTSPGALREGVIYEMMGRQAHEDVRERTVFSLMRRAEVDQHNADQVEAMAMLLFESARESWQLDETDRDLLCWAARLHEIGLSIAHSQFHKHGQYLIEHSDLPGFSKQMQWTLALLVRSHRQKFPREYFAGLDEPQALHLKRLCVIMRLAALFKYVTPVEGEPLFSTDVSNSVIALNFDADWLARHPLTSAALAAEQGVLKKIGFQLRLNGAAQASLSQ